jgi:hypothetical protein
LQAQPSPSARRPRTPSNGATTRSAGVYGTKFGEPFVTQDITKNILSLTHADGWKYGGNFLNIDVLFSDKNDPEDCSNGVL